MKKKILSTVFVVGVLLLGLLLSVGIFRPSAAGANERLADAPAVTDQDGNFNEAVLSDTFAWFNDHFFLRQELISMNNLLTAKLFGISAADNVILGNNGWLYYGSTLEDYTGTNPMSHREIYSAAKNVMLMQEACEAEGKTFAFMIAPNKNSLYPENMPDFGVTAAESNAKKMSQLLLDAGVNYIDVFAAFGEQEEALYFAHDSHWNSRGAALGADLINAALGRHSDYFGADFSQSQLHNGDLYEMLYPAFTDKETDPVYGGKLEFSYESNATNPDSITLLTGSDGEGSLLCYRDSFGILLYPYLADSFEACRFSRSTIYDLTLEADFVVVELVERNLRYLIENLPVIRSPRRQIDLPEISGNLAVEISTPKSTENTILVEGTLTQMPDGDSPVYIVCADGVYEACLLKDNGFGAYLPSGAEVTGVAYCAGGTLQMWAVS